MSRAVHGSVRVGFVPNPQPTRSDRVEKFQTRRRPRKATGRVGSDSGGRRSELISTEINCNKHWRTKINKNQQNKNQTSVVWFLKNKINRSTNPKRRSTNTKNRSTHPKNKIPKNRSTNPQITEPKRWNRKIESERWRWRRAGKLRTKSTDQRQRGRDRRWRGIYWRRQLAKGKHRRLDRRRVRTESERMTLESKDWNEKR